MCAVTVYVAADPLLQRPDARAAAAALRAPARPRLVVVSPANALHPLEAYTSGWSELRRGPVRTAEIDAIGMAARDESTRDRLGRRAELLRPPAGFRVVERRAGERFTLVRLTAASPRAVAPLALGALRLGTGDAAAGVQSP
jgi:hypothetical protein